MTLDRLAHVLAAVQRPWAVRPETLTMITELLALHLAGGRLEDAEVDRRLALAAATNGPRRGGGRAGTVAIVPVYGVIAPRVQNMRTSGGTTVDAIAADFRAALASAEADGIILDIDSPGGVVDGVEELATEIRQARGQKPIVAVANTLAASAAYWIASAADEVVATPSASVGSIGVFHPHTDVSRAEEAEGRRTTLIAAGKYKTEGNPYEPLTDEAREAIQAIVDGYYGMFVSAVARGRGVPVDTVRRGYGEGRIVMAKPALEAGMIDRVDTLSATIRRVARGAVGSRDPETSALIPSAIPEPPSLGAGAAFADRLELASAEAFEIAELARARRALRAGEGRDLSPSTVEAVVALEERLRAAADELRASVAEAVPGPVSREPEPQPIVVGPRARLARALAEHGITELETRPASSG